MRDEAYILRAAQQRRRGTGTLGATLFSEAAAVVAAMTTPPSTARKELISNLVRALMSAGVWSRLDVLHVYAAADSQAALLNWKNPGTFDGTSVSAMAFEADRGFTGDGAADYIDTGFDPAAAAGNMAQNSACVGVWSRTAGQQNNGDVGEITGTETFRFTLRSASNIFGTARVNDATNSNLITGVTDALGLFCVDRPDASNKRGVVRGTVGNNVAVASTALANDNLTVGASVSGTVFSSRQFAAFLAGASLSTEQHGILYSAMLAYMQAVGAA